MELDRFRGRGAVADFAHCVRAWGGLVARRQLRSPKGYVGTHLHFRDGTTSLVFRETVRRAPTLEPTLLVIQFRLAALGSNRWAHAAFRRECVLHTPLFAGFQGFRSKLWADDVTTGVYRGVYEWDGAEAARAYATPDGGPAGSLLERRHGALSRGRRSSPRHVPARSASRARRRSRWLVAPGRAGRAAPRLDYVAVAQRRFTDHDRRVAPEAECGGHPGEAVARSGWRGRVPAPDAWNGPHGFCTRERRWTHGAVDASRLACRSLPRRAKTSGADGGA